MMNNISTIKSLTGLRGFAVLLVLLSHASNKGVSLHESLSFSGAGRYGVFLFFVLSAFLLTKQIIEAAPERKELSSFLQHYFLRRFLRIYPLFIVSLFAYLFFYKLGYGVYDFSIYDVIKSIFLIEVRGIFWTIAVEFQFYFILPFIALFFLRYSSKKITLILPIFFILAWSTVFPAQYVSYLLPFLPVFLLGSFSAYLYCLIQKHIFMHKSLPMISAIVAMVSFALFILLTPKFFNLVFSSNISRTEFHLHFLLWGGISACLVLGTALSRGLIKKIMESKFFVFIGEISFSAYLGHMLILSNMRFLDAGPAIKLIIFLGLTISLSYLSLICIEKPLSKIHRLSISRFKCFWNLNLYRGKEDI